MKTTQFVEYKAGLKNSRARWPMFEIDLYFFVIRFYKQKIYPPNKSPFYECIVLKGEHE